MTTTTLTPFDQFTLNRENKAKQASAFSALLDLIEREKECRLQIEYYRGLKGDDREEERGVTMEAMKDLKALEAAIQILCENFSIEA